MNDPHVDALHYSIRHSEDVDYDNASPRTVDTPGFAVRIENGRAEIMMKSHHATDDTARAEVEPFLRAWELTTALEFGPGQFDLAYDRATIIDRNPTPEGSLFAVRSDFMIAVEVVKAHVKRSKYPDPPPIGIARNPNVDLMFDRFCRYRAGTTTLADAVNFCLTVLITNSSGLGSAARNYAVSETILRTMGKLAANKGGSEARKAQGAKIDFTGAERQWLEETMKRLIRRAAEVAGSPSASLPQITMGDLTPLP
jgi:hypothetical protein